MSLCSLLNPTPGLLKGLGAKVPSRRLSFMESPISDIGDFAVRAGRSLSMLVCKMGQDGHDRGAKVISTAFADLGFEVELSPMFATPCEVARQAVEDGVYIVEVSTQAGGLNTLVPMLVKALIEEGG